MNIGLIGCGRVASLHMNVYAHIKDANVVAVSDIDLRKARTFADKYGIDKVFTNYTDLLEIKDLGFVDICTPTSTHARVVCDVAKSGHDILVEKPMALSTAECERMILESKKHGVKVCVCHNQLFFPSIRKAKSMVDSGDYDLASFRTCFKGSTELMGCPGWISNPGEGGILWEEGYHTAYLQLHFLQNIKEVYAVGSKVKHPVYDVFNVLLRTSGRSYGIIEASWIAKERELSCEISSSDGKIAQIDLKCDHLLEKTGAVHRHKNLVYRFYTGEKRLLGGWIHKAGTLLKTRFPSMYGLSHFYLIKSYMESLENDSSPPVQPEEGKEVIKLLECIEVSLDKHQAVPIK